METMFLVAGLAVAGLVGIAAAFYFSIRPGNSGKKRGSRVQPDRTSHTRPDRYQVNDSSSNRGRTAGRAATTRNYRAAERSTGPNAVPDHRGAGRSRARRPETDADRWAPEVEAPALHADRWDPEPEEAGLPVAATAAGPMDGATRAARGSSRPGSRRAAAEADAEQDGAAKSKRRSGWLKRGDIDEELWPTEAFGVSDEQFWDDMASDKPLATTARTAQPDSGSRRRPPDAVPLAGAGAPADAASTTGAAAITDAAGPRGRSTRRVRSRLRPDRGRTGPGRSRPRPRPRPRRDRTTRRVRSRLRPDPSRTRPDPSHTRQHPSRIRPDPSRTRPDHSRLRPGRSRLMPRPATGPRRAGGHGRKIRSPAQRSRCGRAGRLTAGRTSRHPGGPGTSAGSSTRPPSHRTRRRSASPIPRKPPAGIQEAFLRTGSSIRFRAGVLGAAGLPGVTGVTATVARPIPIPGHRTPLSLPR